MKSLKIIVGGYIGLYSIGGATWDYLQYPLGFHLLGHEVYYIEDTNQYPVYQVSKTKWDDCSDCVEHLKNAMEDVGLKGRWAYRDVVTGKTFGMSDKKVKEICATADIFINVSASTQMRDEYISIPVTILIDTDPMFTQIQYNQEDKTSGSGLAYLTEYDFLFTFGLNINSSDNRIPLLGVNWHTTKKPIVLKEWSQPKKTDPTWGFTSILNWVERPAFEHDGEMWGQKNIIFEQFVALPEATGKKFDLIINRGGSEEAEKAMATISERKWNVLEPYELIVDKNSYRKFIQTSFAEFSLTKEAYIKSNSGWFSGRSACYLAAGRPVITQDTTWSRYIPAGEGLFACNTLQQAINAVESITKNYDKYANAAREIAAEYFDSSKVLTDILCKIN